MQHKLDRSTIEAYSGIGIAIITVVVPMTWLAQSALALILIFLIFDISFHSPLTIKKHWSTKLVICAFTIAFVSVIFWNPISNAYQKDRSIDNDLNGTIVADCNPTVMPNTPILKVL